MNEAEWQALAEYVDKLRIDLLLGHWEIVVQRDPPESDDTGVDASLIDAQVVITSNGYFAKLRVHEDFRQGDPDHQRATILHELLHLHSDKAFSDALDAIEGLAGAQANAVANMLLRRGYERSIEAMAQAIAPKYPVIEWPIESNDGPQAEGR